MNDAIEILKQIYEDVESAAATGDKDLFWGRMIANAHDAEMFIKKYS